MGTTNNWILPSPQIFAGGDAEADPPKGSPDSETTFAGLWRDESFSRAFAADQLTVPVGVDDDGHGAFAELSNDAILLVSGPSESGRLRALRCILAGVSMGATPGDVQLLLTDLRGDGYGDLAKVPHVLDSPISEPREALDSLNNMITEVNSRFDQMGGHAVRNISDLDQIQDHRASSSSSTSCYRFCVLTKRQPSSHSSFSPDAGDLQVFTPSSPRPRRSQCSTS